LRLSFRSKLQVLVATAALALVALVVSSAIVAGRVERHLDEIRRQYLPKVGLRPQLAGQFERIQRGFQDAVAASDSEKLAMTVELKKEFLQQLAASSDAVGPALAATLAQAVEDFHAKGMAVSARLIARDTGEGVVAQMAEMQARQARVAELLDRATIFDKAELTNAFSAAAEAQRTGSLVRLGISFACLILVLLLSLWISRGVLRGLSDLTAGFGRFGKGDFGSAIPVVSSDELGDLARQANQMAQSLQRLESERASVDWLKNCQSGLTEQLRGELEPRELADRAVAFLCRWLDCPVGALYSRDPDGVLRLLGQHALSAGEGTQSFRPGEGLVGQAALQGEITVVQAPADQLRVSSGLAQGWPRSIALVPLLRIGKVTGVLELASLHPWKEVSTELLASVRETLAIALDVARGRAELRALLAETQRQTRELEAQRGALEEKNAALVDTRLRLEQQADEITKASTYKSQFLANMSHELRTPLNAILGFTQLLHEGEVGPLNSEQRDFLGNVLTSGGHLLRLINDVLDLAKIESGKLDFRPEPIDLPQVIGELSAILRTTSADKNVRLEMEVDPAIGTVVLDPARLKQVLYNYLSNALKFTPSGGRVLVRALTEGAESFRLEVHDTGPGLQPADLGRLFVEFQQLDAGAAKKHAGTGLGLALTKRIVEAQGGSVGVRSTPGAGSVFHAVLPRQAKAEARLLVPLPMSTRREGAPEILVVEDSAADQLIIVEALSAAGFSVQTAATGAQALARFRERSFDALTLDLFLPDMSGVDLLARIRAEARNADIPVVVLTVVAEAGAVAGFTVSDVLAKPIDTAALLDALRRAGVAPERSGAVLVVDDDQGCLNLMQATLGRSGYETICRRDGEAALAAAEKSHPLAVILDLMMPGIDGFEFLERFRRTEAGRNTPVIIWTVKDLSDQDLARLRETAHAIVPKGSDGAASLLRALNGFLPRRQEPKMRVEGR
jgi:signal transduction histidine kinase/DNA-binding response OmpR family regulator